MRTVLVGSDFMYDKDGNLKPIEINTAVGWHQNKVEENESTLDLTALSTFITEHGFTKIVFIGDIAYLDSSLSNLSQTLGIQYEMFSNSINAITIPYVEDTDTHLIIRSAYDTTAIVDDTYCKDKVNFLNLIKNESFGAQFAYVDEDNNLVNNITSIPDNGIHPNFILKSVLPQYDKEVYPKLYRVNTQEELDVVLQNVDSNYFLMEFYYNPNELIENHIKVFRGLNLLFPPNLESISLGGYTRVCDDSVEIGSTFDTITHELISNRKKYLSADYQLRLPKLSDTDLVLMADDTYKIASDLVIGDLIKTIDIPNPFVVDNNNELVNYKITLSELETGTIYSTNKITNINKINVLSYIIKFTFTDGTDWFDSRGSKYLSIRNNEVRFLVLPFVLSGDEFSINVGDNILLLDTSNTETPTFVTKEIASIEQLHQFFGGYEITVENARLFLTKSNVDSDKSYVSIEHNVMSCDGDPNCAQGSCGKGSICCNNPSFGQICQNAGDFCASCFEEI